MARSHAPHWLALFAAIILAGCGSAPPAPSTPQAPAAPVSPGEPASVAGGCLRDAPKPPADAQRIVVSRVVDGDTVHLASGVTARLIGINTPESVDPRRPVQAYGKEASAYTKQLLEGKEVLLQPGRSPKDQYGRLLAWLWLPDGRFVNALLVRDGYAQVYTFSDNPDNAQELLACQREARAANRGLWALDVYQSGQEAAKMDRGASTARSAPTPSPVAAPATAVRITREPGSVVRGGTATVAAQTTPGANCTIAVIYKSGPSQTQGLTPRQADDTGSVSWRWAIASSTSTGTWPVRIACGGQEAETTITVR